MLSAVRPIAMARCATKAEVFVLRIAYGPMADIADEIDKGDDWRADELVHGWASQSACCCAGFGFSMNMSGCFSASDMRRRATSK